MIGLAGLAAEELPQEKEEIPAIHRLRGMSGETEIEVSVVSEEDLELEGSRSSSTPAELLLQEKNGKSSCGLSNHHHSFSFDVGKPALRPACNPQYTSFSISSILGRPESPPVDSTSTVSGERQSSDVDRTSPLPPANSQPSQRILPSCGSPSRVSSSPTSLRLSGGQRGVSAVGGHITGLESRANSAGIGIGCATSATSPAATFSPPGDASANPLLGHQASADLAMLSRYVYPCARPFSRISRIMSDNSECTACRAVQVISREIALPIGTNDVFLRHYVCGKFMRIDGTVEISESSRTMKRHNRESSLCEKALSRRGFVIQSIRSVKVSSCCRLM